MEAATQLIASHAPMPYLLAVDNSSFGLTASNSNCSYNSIEELMNKQVTSWPATAVIPPLNMVSVLRTVIELLQLWQNSGVKQKPVLIFDEAIEFMHWRDQHDGELLTTLLNFIIRFH
jgi:hypothetical protein